MTANYMNATMYLWRKDGRQYVQHDDIQPMQLPEGFLVTESADLRTIALARTPLLPQRLAELGLELPHSELYIRHNSRDMLTASDLDLLVGAARRLDEGSKMSVLLVGGTDLENGVLYSSPDVTPTPVQERVA